MGKGAGRNTHMKRDYKATIFLFVCQVFFINNTNSPTTSNIRPVHI